MCYIASQCHVMSLSFLCAFVTLNKKITYLLTYLLIHFSVRKAWLVRVKGSSCDEYGDSDYDVDTEDTLIIASPSALTLVTRPDLIPCAEIEYSTTTIHSLSGHTPHDLVIIGNYLINVRKYRKCTLMCSLDRKCIYLLQNRKWTSAIKFFHIKTLSSRIVEKSLA